MIEKLKLLDAELEKEDKLSAEVLNQLILACLPCIGQYDPKIRDERGYPLLAESLRNEKCSNDTRQAVFSSLTSDQYLFYKINDGESDDSVRRSFSLLALAECLAGDKSVQHLVAQIPSLIELLKKYRELEKDLREETPELGYIDAIGHFEMLEKSIADYRKG